MTTGDKTTAHAGGGLQGDTCLHCALWQAIWDHFERRNGAPNGSSIEVLNNVGQVIAEVIAGIDDRRERKRVLREIQNAIAAAVPALRKDGQHPMIDSLH